MVEKTSPRKFGSIAGTIGFGFIVFGIALYQIVLRDHVPPVTIGDGWYDWGRSFGAGICGAISGLIGGLIGYFVERRVRG